MTLEASVLQDDAVRAVPGGYEIDVHLPWYRSLPLSCVEGVQVSVNGETPDGANLRFRVGERELALDELADAVDVEWFVQDPLTVLAPSANPAAAGTEVEVHTALATRIPYIIIGPSMALVQRTEVARKVTVR